MDNICHTTKLLIFILFSDGTYVFYSNLDTLHDTIKWGVAIWWLDFSDPTFSDPSDPTFFCPEFKKSSQPCVFLVVGGNN